MSPDPQHSDEDWSRLARHLSGEGTPEERRADADWVAADPARRALAERLAPVWAAARRRQAPRERWDVDAAWAAARASGALSSGGASASGGRARWAAAGARRWRVAVTAAAAAVVLAAVGWRAAGRLGLLGIGGERVVATGPGERRSITLRDGSRVQLGAASRLRIVPSGGRDGREVELEGVGFFAVVHNGSAPFVVRFPGGVAIDVGTEFTVRAYAGGEPVVAVASGAVSVRGGADGARGRGGVTLQAGHVARIRRSGEAVIDPQADLAAQLAWTRGALAFDDTPLAEVAAELERWYGVRCEVEGPGIAGRRLSAHFQGESLPEVLDVIARSLDVQAERTGDQVRFRGARAGGS